MSSSTTATAPRAVPAPAELARAFVTPDRSRARPAWVELPPAQRGELAFDGETLALYQWGTEGPVVVLVHGWDGSHAAKRCAPLSRESGALQGGGVLSHRCGWERSSFLLDTGGVGGEGTLCDLEADPATDASAWAR